MTLTIVGENLLVQEITIEGEALYSIVHTCMHGYSKHTGSFYFPCTEILYL